MARKSRLYNDLDPDLDSIKIEQGLSPRGAVQLILPFAPIAGVPVKALQRWIESGSAGSRW